MCPTHYHVGSINQNGNVHSFFSLLVSLVQVSPPRIPPHQPFPSSLPCPLLPPRERSCFFTKQHRIKLRFNNSMNSCFFTKQNRIKLRFIKSMNSCFFTKQNRIKIEFINSMNSCFSTNQNRIKPRYLKYKSNQVSLIVWTLVFLRNKTESN